MNKLYSLVTLLLTVSFSANAQAQSQGLLNYNKRLNAPIYKSENRVENNYISPASVLFTDDFNSPNDTTSLKSRGYLIYYRGTGPQGVTPLWYTGYTGYFNSLNGPDSGYVASDYESVSGINDIDNWLVLPPLNVWTGDTLSFYSRSPTQDSAFYFRDSIKVMYAANGDSVPEGTGWVLLGNFQVDTSNWTRTTFIAPASGSNARFAIRYAVAEGGPFGNNAFYIGIDQIDVIQSATVDVQQNNLTADIKVYPIPAKDIVYVSLTDIRKKSAAIEIFNSLGSLVYRNSFMSESTRFTDRIDVSKWRPGLYITKIITGDQLVTRKIVVQ